MLGKLLKYDLMHEARTFLGMGTAVLLLSAIASASLNLDRTGDISSMIIMILAMVLMGVAVASVVLVFQSYSKNLFGREGYLMLTLPVRRGALLASKCISAMIWFVFMMLVAMLSVFIITGDAVFRVIFAAMGQGLFWYYMLLGLLGVMSLIISVYLIITVANISVRRRRVGVALAVIACFVYFWLGGLLYDHVLNPLLYDAMSVAWQFDPSEMLTRILPAQIPMPDDVTTGMVTVQVSLLSMLWSAASIAVNFLIIRFLINRKINLP